MAVRYTEEQKACVEQLVGPVDVSAGAGSGKTFTLTQRIAQALAEPDSGVDDIDQVCAITFTEKAAAELKGRVRSTLRAQGLFDQALKVDAAWISTIHGMCARILRASALDLGLDPSFGVSMGKEAADLLDESLNDAIEAAGGPDGPFADLFSEYAATSKNSETSVKSLVYSLIGAAGNVPAGLDGLVALPGTIRPREVARRLLEAYRAAEPFYAQASANKTNDAARDAAAATLAALEPYVAGEGDDTPSGLFDVLDRCPIAGALRARDLKEPTTECKDAHFEAIAAALLMRGDVVLAQALDLARDAEARYVRAKRESALLDSTDLIKGALAALERPDVLARFADKFRLVMVDEFQDTDELQLAIVRKLSGPGMRYLCTVGDAQQSIYGFRGADINVYRAYQRELREPALVEQGGSPHQLRLTKNFRSHRDILAFVKKVCAQACVFGGEFLDLSDSYDGANYCAGEEPRVQIHVTSLVPDGRRGAIGDAVEVQAQRIAGYFARMHRAGHPLSDMVLLLGATTNAERYATAIRDAGFPCIIAGGSLFAKAPEVQTVNELLQAIANPRNTASLFAALSGPAFNLGASDLLALGTGVDEETGQAIGRKLYRGVSEAAFAQRLGEELSPALAHAVEVMGKAQRNLRFEPLDEVLTGVLRDSGWVARLEAQGAEGMAKLGNVMKAVRLVHDTQSGYDFGVARTARRFAALLDEGMKEAPGALNLGGQEAIRIMTIHASKGLEFPIVAMADFARKPWTHDLVVRRVGKETFVSLKGKSRAFAGKDVSQKAFGELGTDVDPARVSANDVRLSSSLRRRALLTAVSEYEELSEQQRLFYVGATRAKEALGLFIAFKESRDPQSAYVSTIDDIRSAFFGHEPFSDECTELDYGGSAPARFDYKRVFFADVQAERERAAAEAVPVVGKVGEMAFAACKPICRLDEATPARLETGLRSYSSLGSIGGDNGGFASAIGDAAAKESLSARIASTERSHAAAQDDGALEGAAPAMIDEVVRTARERAAELKIQVAAEGDDEGLVTQAYRDGTTADDDKATEFGSALHRLCQIVALRGEATAFAHLDRAAATYRVADRERLRAALERWCTSRAHAFAQTFASRQPELSFSVPLGEVVLEGEIDLLCTNEHVRAGDPGEERPRKALVVDYKTGGDAGESLETLRVKHGLQACCYAYATLLQGYDQVDVAFARVERDDPFGTDTLQSVCFAFFAQDIDRLRDVIASCL